MARDTLLSAWPATREARDRRWEELLGNIVGLLPTTPVSVLVEGGDAAAAVADRLAAALREAGRPCVRDGSAGADAAGTVTLGCGAAPGSGWDVLIWLRVSGGCAPGGHEAEARADIVVDLHDPDWPVIRTVAARLAGNVPWYVTESRAFFACRAATWDTKYGDALPAYAAAIAEADIREGGVAIDVGCGTGRALPALRRAVGPGGTVVAFDLTPEMLHQAGAAGRRERAARVVADACRLPLRDASVDAVFAAGLVTHLPDTAAGLRQFARVTRPGGLLILFHPSGRAALAARHGQALRPDEPLAEEPLRGATAGAGWRLRVYDDPVDRFLAIAVRE